MIPALLHDPALQAVLDALPQARLVGGCVRDVLAGRSVADVDLATPDRPEDVVAALHGAGLRSVPTGLAHGTITAVSDHQGFEVTTLRRDVTTDGRHAEVAWTDDWQIDAARRDFTMNAMSMARDGTVFDFFGGRTDLAAGLVRFVGDPAARIAEDYLRILRFFRFQARYGRQPPDDDTIVALREGVPGLAFLSPERVWSELKRILLAPDPVASLQLMAELGILRAILPEVAGLDRLGRLIAAGAPPDPILRLASLLSGTMSDAIGLRDRLRLSNEEGAKLAALMDLPPDPDSAPHEIRRALADTPAPVLIDRSWLMHDAGGAELRARLAAEPPPVFALAGRDALALGMAPGPAVGGLIRDVRAWWMAGGCVATAAECRAELAARVASAAR